MLSYRDRTYCPGDGCTAFATCPRALTDAVKAAAEKWWGGLNAPISLWENPKALPCYQPKTPDL